MVTRVSPDGNLLGVTTGDVQPAVVNLGNPGAPTVVSGAESTPIVVGWSADSKSVFLSSLGYEPEIVRVELASGRRELVRRIVPRDRADVFSVYVVAVTPDAKQILLNIVRATNSDLWIAEGIR